MTFNSHWMRIADAYTDWLITQGLSGVKISPASPASPVKSQMRIRICKLPIPTQDDEDHRVLYVFPQTERVAGIVIGNGEYAIGYGFGTVLCWPSNQKNDNTSDNMDDWLQWRELTRDKLEPLSETIFSLTDPLLNDAAWEPGVIYGKEMFKRNYDTQGFTMRGWVRYQSKSRTFVP